MVKLLRNMENKGKSTNFVSFLLIQILKKSTYSELFPIMGFIYLVCHVVACMWHFFAFTSQDPEAWIYRTNYVDEGIWNRYFASLYFVFQTVIVLLSRLLQLVMEILEFRQKLSLS